MDFLTRKIVYKYCNIGKFNFFSEGGCKFRDLQISKILNTDTNIFFPIPAKVMYLFLR